MNKSILVIDKPRVCSECDLFKNYYDEEHEDWNYACALTEKVIDIDEAEERKHKDCPLKELPPRQSTYGTGCPYSNDYMRGFNDCLKAILGKEE